ncbi:MAG TPA: hypothetical protein VI685_12400 [Candidatus Angelobacter sp.]
MSGFTQAAQNCKGLPLIDAVCIESITGVAVNSTGIDEAAFMPEAGDSYNNALPVCKKIVVVSSAGPGWFAETVTDTV